MTVAQLIKALEKIQAKYPNRRRSVTVDISKRRESMDGDWTHREVARVSREYIGVTEGEGIIELADGSEKMMDCAVLTIEE